MRCGRDWFVLHIPIANHRQFLGANIVVKVSAAAKGAPRGPSQVAGACVARGGSWFAPRRSGKGAALPSRGANHTSRRLAHTSASTAAKTNRHLPVFFLVTGPIPLACWWGLPTRVGRAPVNCRPPRAPQRIAIIAEQVPEKPPGTHNGVAPLYAAWQPRAPGQPLEPRRERGGTRRGRGVGLRSMTLARAAAPATCKEAVCGDAGRGHGCVLGAATSLDQWACTPGPGRHTGTVGTRGCFGPIWCLVAANTHAAAEAWDDSVL
jgi:hypothetical protein